ncbi:hypothetical protein ACA30_13510 [Virgibacillus soli]|nr:hypothetical protein ACA30_13510 [Virgibacillus soli]
MNLKISNGGRIRIPKNIHTELNWTDGRYLFVYEFQNCIMIEKYNKDKTLNQCLFSNGRITIPIELRRLLNISPNSFLSMDVSCNKVILKSQN